MPQKNLLNGTLVLCFESFEPMQRMQTNIFNKGRMFICPLLRDRRCEDGDIDRVAQQRDRTKNNFIQEVDAFVPTLMREIIQV